MTIGKHRWVWSLAALGMVAGCSGHHAQPPAQRLLYSPNGEPLGIAAPQSPACREMLSRWFMRMDSSHSGGIDRLAFMADARVQFQHMDIDGNGYLVSEEVERFRRPYRGPDVLPEAFAAPQSSDAAQPKQGKHRRKETRGEDAQSAPQTDSFDPVMSADTNLDFKVTLDEFLAHSARTFAELDTNGDGRLTLEEVAAPCEPKK